MKHLIYTAVFISSILLLAINMEAFASDPHHHHSTTVINNNNSAMNNCKGIALSAAGANNQMYLGTRKPQLSIGVGSCGDVYAGSLMFGIRPCSDCPMVNGSVGAEGNTRALGAGITVLF